MGVTIEYMTQIRDAAGLERETAETPPGATVGDAVAEAAHRHGSPLHPLLLDDTGAPHPWLLLVLNETVVRPSAEIRDGDTLCITSPISGG